MIGRALDENNDLIIENGRLKVTSDLEELTQHVRTRLLFYRNEWFLDQSAGIPYFDSIFTKPANLANIESVIKAEILNTPGVIRLVDFFMDYERSPNRKLSIVFSAQSIYGEFSNLEVIINE